MRSSQVTPIAVFDGKGERLWKAVAHAERDNRRSIALARSLQERSREERILEFGAVLKEAYGWPKEREAGEDSKEVVLEKLKKLQESLERMKLPPSKPVARSLLKAAEDLNQVVEGEAEVEVEAVLEDSDTVKESESLEAAEIEITEEANNSQPISDSKDHDARIRPESEVIIEEEPAPTSQIPIDEVDIVSKSVPPISTTSSTPRQVSLNETEGNLLTQAIQVVSTPTRSGEELDRLDQERLVLLKEAKTVAVSYNKAIDMPTSADMAEAQELLEAMGVPVLVADPPWEAEGLCSALVRANLADFVGTEDTDVLAYRTVLLRNVADSKKPLVTIHGEEVREGMKYSPEQFLDFMVLCGVDACERIYKVGPSKAMKLLQKYDNIESIFEHEEVGKIRVSVLAKPGYLDRVRAARQVFTDMPPVPEKEELLEAKISDEAVAEFLRERHGIVLDAQSDDYTAGLEAVNPFSEAEDVQSDFDSRGMDDIPEDLLSALELDFPEFKGSSSSTRTDPACKGSRQYSSAAGIGSAESASRARLRSEFRRVIRLLQLVPDPEIR